MSRSRRRPLALRLALAVVTVGVGAMIVVGAYGFWEAREVLNSSVRRHLDTLQSGRAEGIVEGVERVRGRVAVTALDGSVVTAVTELAGAWEELRSADDLLDDASRAEVEAFYVEVAAEVAALDLDLPDAAGLMPATDVGRYLQAGWTVGVPAEERREANNSGRGDEYDAVHEIFHPVLRGMADQLGFDDLLIVDAATLSVVYSVEKRVDLGASLGDGVLRESALGRVVVEQLARVPLGEAAYVDVEPYLPARGAPQFFVTVAVREGSRVVGALVAAIPLDGLNQLTGAGRWEELGLADRGEVYLAGPDLVLRSDSRLWLEDPDEFLERTTDDVAARASAFGSSAGVQPADTAAVRAALEGETFTGQASNYLGQKTLTVAAPVGLDGLNWVVVADLAFADAQEPLWQFLRHLGVILGLLILTVLVVSWVLGRALVRPVRPLVQSAQRIGSGDLDTPVEGQGSGELGDLGRRLDELRVRLSEQRERLAAEDAEVEELLASALPEHLVDRVREGDLEASELIQSVTVVSLTVSGLLDRTDISPDVALELSAEVDRRVEQLATEHELSVMRSSSTDLLLVAGRDEPGNGASDALRFVTAVVAVLGELSREHGVTLDLGGGLASGDVMTAVVQGAQLSVGMLGQAPRIAMALDGVSGAGQVLLHSSTVEALEDRSGLTPAGDLLALDGQPVDVMVLQVAIDPAVPSTSS